MDLFYVVEYDVGAYNDGSGAESWRSHAFRERRLAERLVRSMQKRNPGKEYRLELRMGNPRKW